MNSISWVETCWGARAVFEKPFWHLVTAGGLFYHNVRVAKGGLLSISAGIEGQPDLQNAHTGYSLNRMNNPKEKVFEDVREKRYPHLPSRLKTLYVLDDFRLVKRAIAEWFPEMPVAIHECRVLVGAKVHKADASWLNSSPDQWGPRAEEYWAGHISEKPFFEVLVHGALYFPAWESFPTGEVSPREPVPIPPERRELDD